MATRNGSGRVDSIEVDELQPNGEEEWRAYVENAPRASLYHRLEWRQIILQTFGHRAHYLIARQRGVVRGVLPMIEMQSRLFGHFFVSLPFVNYGGILADAPEHEAALATAAIERAMRRGARHIELRHSVEAAGWSTANWKLRQHKAALIVPLDTDEATRWSNLSSRLRGKVRKAEKFGATFSVGDANLLEDFYRVYSLNMRNLGTPVYSPELFRNVLRSSKEAAVLLVRRAGQPIAAAIALRHRDTVELPWICSDYSYSSLYANEFLYWNAIHWSYELGVRELDLGRSSIDAGTYRFKLQWNPEVRPLFWRYWLSPGTELPQFSAGSPKYALAVRYWKKIPVAVANQIGPWIVRNIP
jgi:serine/alanine adding enzyme